MECELYTILQLCDSAYPTGGFSHSMGAESAVQNLYMDNKESLKIFVLSCLENSGSLCIPFVKAAYEATGNITELLYLDGLHNSSLLNHVGYRASKQQGKAFLTTSSQVFLLPQIEQLIEVADNQEFHCHLPIVFAVVCAALKVPLLKVGEIFLFNCLRTIVASIVRLGKVGTVEAQRFQFEIQSYLKSILYRNWNLMPEDSHIIYPVTEVLQNSHDASFTKLFFS